MNVLKGKGSEATRVEGVESASGLSEFLKSLHRQGETYWKLKSGSPYYGGLAII